MFERIMQRRGFMAILAALAGLGGLWLWRQRSTAPKLANVGSSDIEPLQLSPAQWRDRLSERAYRVLRQGTTEPRGSSSLLGEQRQGTYHCAGCDLLLFRSAWKYDSGTGWPSFYRVVRAHVETQPDNKLLYRRTEYHCARCGGHQGHVFEDGPDPTGLRWCNNGVALTFHPSAT